MAIKISKIQKRLAQSAALRTAVVRNHYKSPQQEHTYSPEPDPVGNPPSEPHVVFMSARDAQDYNLEGAAVLSLVSNFLDTSKVRDYKNVHFDVADISRKAVGTIHDFVEKNIDCERFIIHCTYGEQRSRAVAHYVKRVIDESRGNRSFGIYRYECGNWACDLDKLPCGDMRSYKDLMLNWKEVKAVQ